MDPRPLEKIIRILWLAGANEATLPEPILSRFRIFTVRAAEGDALEVIVRNVYAEPIADYRGFFTKTLERRVRDTLCADSGSTRDLIAPLRTALGRAALAGGRHIDT